MNSFITKGYDWNKSLSVGRWGELLTINALRVYGLEVLDGIYKHLDNYEGLKVRKGTKLRVSDHASSRKYQALSVDLVLQYGKFKTQIEVKTRRYDNNTVTLEHYSNLGKRTLNNIFTTHADILAVVYQDTSNIYLYDITKLRQIVSSFNLDPYTYGYTTNGIYHGENKTTTNGKAYYKSTYYNFPRHLLNDALIQHIKPS